MSNEPKKYPADTPVTLEMLSDMLRKAAVKYKSPFAGWFCETLEEHIEPPKPEPRIGELWLCLCNTSQDRFALWKFTDGWSIHQTGSKMYPMGAVTPLARLIPMEDNNE